MTTADAAETASDEATPLPGNLFVQPETLTILATYKCTAACENCCFGSNPRLTQRLGLPEIKAFIREGARYPRCQIVVFSGGECFLLGDDLALAIEHATRLGLETRCVTNGYWAKSLRHGRSRLEAVKRAGLSELNISTGDYHQRWVTQDTVVNAACLSVELGFKSTVIVIELQRDRRVTKESLLADERVAALLARHGSRFRVIESPWMPMDHSDSIDQHDDMMLSRRTLHMRGGCRSILNTLVVTPSQRVGLCCGLSRERIPELNLSWDGGSLAGVIGAAARDFMKIWLYVDGPERILAWAASKDERIEWEDRYAHHCHSCLALFDDPLVREAIRRHHRERVDDVLLRYVARLRIEQRPALHYAETAGVSGGHARSSALGSGPVSSAAES